MWFSLVSVVCCQIGVSVMGRSLVQKSPTTCGDCVCVCDLKTSTMWQPRPKYGCCTKKNYIASFAKAFQNVLKLNHNSRKGMYNSSLPTPLSR